MMNKISDTGAAGGVCVTALETLNTKPLPETVSVTRWQNNEKIQVPVKPVPFGSDRAQIIWEATSMGDLCNSMTDGEIAYINALWKEMPGEFSFADTLLLVLQAPEKSKGGREQ